MFPQDDIKRTIIPAWISWKMFTLTVIIAVLPSSVTARTTVPTPTTAPEETWRSECSPLTGNVNPSEIFSSVATYVGAATWASLNLKNYQTAGDNPRLVPAQKLPLDNIPVHVQGFPHNHFTGTPSPSNVTEALKTLPKFLQTVITLHHQMVTNTMKPGCDTRSDRDTYVEKQYGVIVPSKTAMCLVNRYLEYIGEQLEPLPTTDEVLSATWPSVLTLCDNAGMKVQVDYVIARDTWAALGDFTNLLQTLTSSSNTA